jgi:hypothetical protein
VQPDGHVTVVGAARPTGSAGSVRHGPLGGDPHGGDGRGHVVHADDRRALVGGEG